MALLLYIIVGVFLLLLAHHTVRPILPVAAVALLLLPLLFTGRALLSGRVFGPIDLPYGTEPLLQLREANGIGRQHNSALNDVAAQEIPWRSALKYSIGHGVWPLLDPFLLCGAQLAGSGQPAAWSPFTLISLLLPLGASISFSATIAFFLAAVCSYLFARELGCRDMVSLFAAAGWMCATPIAFFIEWPIGTAWALLPFVLLATRRLIESPTIRNAFLLMTALVLLVLAGHPETALQVVAIGLLYGVVELARRRRDLVPPIVFAFGAGIMALAVTAIYLLPLLDATHQTIEYGFRIGYYATQPHVTVPGETRARLLADLFPHLLGRSWSAGYTVPMDSFAVGGIVLGVALYALWRSRHRDKWFFAALAIFGALARTGFPPLMNLLQKLPLFDIAINERFAFAGAFALVILAALGLEEFARRRPERDLAIVLNIVLMLIFIGGLIIDHSHMIIAGSTDWGRQARTTEVVALGLAALAAALRWRLGVAMILALLLGQRYIEVGDIYPALPAAATIPDIPILRPLLGRKDLFRIVAPGYAFLPNLATIYGLEDVRGYEAMTFSRYFTTYPLWCQHQPVSFNRVDDLTRPFLSMMNVRYAIQSPIRVTPSGWTVVASQPGALLLENPHWLPRAFIPRNVRFLDDYGTAVNEMRDTADFSELAWISGTPLPPHEEPNASGSVVARRENLELRLDADMGRGGWVVISEAGWTGWKTYIDGRRVRWFPANHAFIGLWVPSGKHKIRLAYIPESFVIGRGITLAALLSLPVLAFFLRQRRSRSKTELSDSPIMSS
ncbi:MAG TPA: YfhO family protein [Thermoanaerobaculia bacterium]|nr:YfhO family protein [Thermoanaerobaculia bacterium]